MARDLFMSSDQQRTMDLLQELRVEYVYIGPLERTLYPHTIAKFGQLASAGQLEIAHQNALVTIYAVP